MSELNRMLEHIREQAAKGHWWNALSEATLSLVPYLLKRQNAVLKGEPWK